MITENQSAEVQQRKPLNNRCRFLLSALLALVIAWHWGGALSIEFKARLAQVLIEKAWQQQLDDPRHRARPWPWADTYPVARLQWLDQARQVKRDLYVLAGTEGSSLAFGPGKMIGLGETQTKVIAGHRDTHFSFLEQLKQGDQLRWQGENGIWRNYSVHQLTVADSGKEEMWVDTESETLWLVTCYPFDTLLTGGPLRYLVQAEAVDEGRRKNISFSL